MIPVLQTIAVLGRRILHCLDQNSHLQFATSRYTVHNFNYSYTRSVTSKIFNYKRSLQQIDFNSLSQNPLPCTCPGSEFLYAPCGHVVTGDLSIVQNDKLIEIFYAKAQNSGNLSHFHDTRTFILSWMHVKRMPGNGPRNMDVELDTLSEWIKSIGEVVKRRI